ncbi:MAG: hypothetical protein HY587_01020 [Candidatus Omnitrophica bacterium]|nr:hypothetical protein [Candidatus Omnitrophota bacterium]
MNNLRSTIAVGLGIGLLLGFVNIRSFIVSDTLTNSLISLSLVRDGNFELSEFEPILRDRPAGQDFWALRTQKGLFTKYPVLTGIIAAPFFAVFSWFDFLAKDKIDFWLKLGRIYSLVLCGIFSGILFATTRKFVPVRWAVVLTFFSVFGTGIWFYTGSQLSNQTLSLLCITTILWMLVKMPANRFCPFVLGLLAGISLSARPAALFPSLVPFGIYLHEKALRKLFFTLIAGFSLPCFAAAAYNYAAFGSPFITGYSFVPWDHFSASILEGLPGLLISPTSGLLFYSPFLVFGICFGLRSLFYQNRANGSVLSKWLVFSFLGHWILLSRWHAWHGGLAYGSRMMLETIPALTLLIAQNWHHLEKSAALKRLLLVTGIASVLMYLLGTVTFDAVAESWTDKNGWCLQKDFIMLYVKERSWKTLIVETIRKGATFAAIAWGLYFILKRCLCHPKSQGVAR